jgi:hypothetical protein
MNLGGRSFHSIASVAERYRSMKNVFHRYGDRYYLAQVWIAGFKPWELVKSSSEPNGGVLAKNSRSGKFKPEVVSVIAYML